MSVNLTGAKSGATFTGSLSPLPEFVGSNYVECDGQAFLTFGTNTRWVNLL
jgi:hypothetical protein